MVSPVVDPALLSIVIVVADAKAVDNARTAPRAESFEYSFIHPPKFRMERSY
jgi:hypothetical protein